MTRALTMNNLTLIILVSFSVINILYMGSDLLVKRVENASKQSGDCKQEEPEPECQKCNEFLSCQGQTNEKIVRQTKTSTKSKILGNGDLVEQTTVTEVIETITHTGVEEDGSQECSEETTNSYYECLETCKDIWRGKEKDPEEKDIKDTDPVVPFGCKPTENVSDVKNIDAEGESESDSEPLVENGRFLEQLIPNSTCVPQSSDLSQPTSDDNEDMKEHKEEDPPPPHIKLATGLQCCLSRLVTSAIRSWTFYLSGLIRDTPLYCTDSCLYTRDNDSTSYCFSGDKSSSCTTNITSLMRVHQYNFRVELDDLKTKEEILAESKSVPVMKLNTKKSSCNPPRAALSCCPVKQVVGEGEDAGLFVLRGKTPDRRDQCADNCIYVKVGDIKQNRYCFGIGDLGTACHQKVPSISTLLHTNTTFKQRPRRLDKVATKSQEQNSNKSYQSEKPTNLMKKTHEDGNSSNRHDIKENTKTDESELKMNTTKEMKEGDTAEIKKNTKQDEKKEETNEIRKNTKKNQKTKEYNEIKRNTKRAEKKGKINDIEKNTKGDEKKEGTDEIRKNTERDEKKVLIPLLLKDEPVKLIEDEIPVAINAIEILDEKVKEIIEMKVFIHNGIHIRKMPKEESFLNSTNVDNKTEMKTVNTSQTNKDDASFSLKINSAKSSTNGSAEETVLVFSKKCSTGVPMKIRKIEKQEEPLSIEKHDDKEEVFEEPLKISRHMRLPVKLKKLSETPIVQKDSRETEPKKEDGLEKEKVTKKCNGKHGAPEKSLRIPFQLGKNETIEQNNSTANKSSKNAKPDGKTAINSTLSSEETSGSPNVKNDTKTTTGHIVYKLNKTRADFASNETGTKVEKKTSCTNINNMASEEGKRTLPYRITLPERPKLINRKKDSEDSVKAEIPIQIACCTGKPYKLKTLQKKNSEPVKIDAELPEPRGFAPVKLTGGDSVLEI